MIRHLVPVLIVFIIAGIARGEEAAADPHLSQQIKAEYLGQDGHDYMQKSPAPGPNDIQDLHVRLSNLPKDDPIASAMFTRQGGGQWAWEHPWGPWKAHQVRETLADGTLSDVADFFMEPSHDEESFGIDARIVFKSGRVAAFHFTAGKSDSRLLMPNVGLKPVWIGQDGHDMTGLSESVGPDGYVDVRIALSGLGTRSEIRKLQIKSEKGRSWEYGRNPQRDLNAELILDPQDKSTGTLYLSPDRDLAGETLTLVVEYANDMTDQATLTAQQTDPRKAMPRAQPIQLDWVELQAEWLGQDGADVTGRGDVHVVISGLPEQPIEVVALSNTGGGYWVWPMPAGTSPQPAAEGQEGADAGQEPSPQAADHGPLAGFYVPQPDEETYASLPIDVKREDGKLHLYFQPFRDERDNNMTLRVRLADGRELAGRFPGGEADPFRRGPLPADRAIVARPGDDLHKLVSEYGTITLSPGEYIIDRPLELPAPVTITGPREAVVRFVQKPQDQPWTYAILVKASNVTLNGFSVRAMKDLRFSDHWLDSSSFIKAPNRGFEKGLRRENLVANLVITNMDFDLGEVTPGEDAKNPKWALDLLHGESATSGKVTHNRWRGGTIDVNYGPWIIADNVYLGPPQHTQSPAAIAAHWSHDITVERNVFEMRHPYGKQWRVFCMNQFGDRVIVRDNRAPVVGMYDDDTINNPNMPEIMITESYRLYFEGRPSGITNAGRVVHVPYLLYGRARPGTVVSVLNGPHAGTWRRIAQPISETCFLLDEPLPEGEYDIHIAHGFTDSAFERNYIDNRNGRSVGVLLAGNHWNFRVADNHLLGGGASILVDCCPTERPGIWGWSHTVMFDVVCEGNLHEDSLGGTEIDVHSDKWAKTATGRTYLTGAYRNNIFKWTPEALAAMQGPRKVEVPPKALRIGRRSFNVTGQMHLIAENNFIDLPPGVDPGQNYELRHGTINGEVITERLGSLPPREAGQAVSAGSEPR